MASARAPGATLARGRSENDEADRVSGAGHQYTTGSVIGALVVIGTVLRSWRLGSAKLSFDETFTASSARMPLGRMLAYLRAQDAHPPLDYLLRRPIALAGLSEGWLRLPSVALSVTALVVAAVWWRRYGRLGVLATLFLAISSFAVTYSHDARMYAGLGLAGIGAAACAAVWLEASSPGHWPLVGVCAAVLGALFLQGGAILVVPGVLAVAGCRRDRSAWRWRAAVGVGTGVWMMSWGPSFIEQARHNGHSWVPLTTPHYALVVLNELVDSFPTLALPVLGLVVAGALLLPAGPLRRVFWTVGVGTALLPVGVGLHFHVLLPRALAFGAWAPLIALAAVGDAAITRSRLVGAAAVAVICSLLAPSTLDAAKPYPAPHAAAFTAVRAEARPGDEVLLTPSWLSPMSDWYFGAQWSSGRHVERPDLAAAGTLVGNGRWTGRAWLIVSVDYGVHVGSMKPCAPTRTLARYVLYCLSDER